ncbi:MAG: UDP-N-acetylmuramate dehydrogenase [Rikenellaceae bacterium]
MIREFRDISLFERNSFHVDVMARRLLEFDSVEDLRAIFSEPIGDWMVLSGGNNVLFTKPFEGTILTPVADEIKPLSQRGDDIYIKVSAGREWDELVAWAAEHDLWGIENLSYIPGKVGAAPIQNIGAYGVEVKDVITSVELYTPASGRVSVMSAEECGFGYRDSVFKRELRGKVIVTAIELKLSRLAKPNLVYGDLIKEVEARGGATLKNIREAVIAIRQSKLPEPSELGNGGSFFKNPAVDAKLAEVLKSQYPAMPIYPIADSDMVKLAAGWLIDRAGMKGYRDGRVGVHERQALVLVNHGGAMGEEILALSRQVQDRVNRCFGVHIEAEVNII